MEKKSAMVGYLPEFKSHLLEEALNFYWNNPKYKEDHKKAPDGRWILDRLRVGPEDTLQVKVNNNSIRTDEVLPNAYTILTKVLVSCEIRKIFSERKYKRNEGRRINITYRLMLKHYRDTPIYGRPIDQDRKFKIESNVLNALFELTRSVPVVYYIDEGHKTIYMKDIDSGENFNKRFNVLDSDTRTVLRYVLVNQNSYIGPNTFRALDHFDNGRLEEVIQSLEERSLIKVLDRDSKKMIFRVIPEIKTRDLFKTSNNGERGLFDSRYLIEDKLSAIERAIETILEVQKVGNMQRPSLDLVIPSPFLEDYQLQDMAFLKYIKNADYNQEKQSSKEFKNSHKEKLEDILKKINLRFTTELKETSEHLIQFNQGDAYPGNFMVSGKKVFLLDFDKSNFSFWLNDFIDFMTGVRLFCGIDKDMESEFYDYVLKSKINKEYITPEQIALDESYKKLINESFDRLFVLTKIKRGLTTLGRLSEIVLKAKDIKPKAAILGYKNTRREYLKNWLEDLERDPNGLELKDVLYSGPKGVLV